MSLSEHFSSEGPCARPSAQGSAQSLTSLPVENAEPVKCKQLGLLWLITGGNSITRQHFVRSAEGQWVAKGKAPLSAILSVSGDSSRRLRGMQGLEGTGQLCLRSSPPTPLLALQDHCSFKASPCCQSTQHPLRKQHGGGGDAGRSGARASLLTTNSRDRPYVY